MVVFEVVCALVELGVSFTLLVAFVLTVVFSSAPHPQFSLRNSLNLGLRHRINKLASKLWYDLRNGVNNHILTFRHLKARSSDFCT